MMRSDVVPRVTVVLPVRNGARYLAGSLASVRAQSLSDWELVAVDDGSTDETPQILASAAEADPRIRVLRNDPALRLPQALNRGFATARGSYWTWTSDDNEFRPEALSVMVDALDRDATVGVVYAGYTVIDADGREVERRIPADVHHLGYSNVVGPCFLYRREVGERVGAYKDDAFLAEDYDFWLRVAGRFRFRRLDRVLYAYRVHPAALGTARRAEVRRATADVLRRQLEGLPPTMRLAALRRLEELAAEEGDRSGARRFRLRALRLAPVAALRRSLSALLRTPRRGGTA